MYQNEICDIEHSIKGIYETYEDEETIRLLHYMYKSNIITLGIDGEKINLTEFNEGQFTFDKKGNHTVYILFDDKNCHFQEGDTVVVDVPIHKKVNI